MRTRSLSLLLLYYVLAACSADPADHLQAAKEALEEKTPALAVIELKNAVKKDPNLAEAWSLLGQIRLREGDLEIALSDLSKAHDLDASDPNTQIARLRTLNGLGRHDEVLAELADVGALSVPLGVVLGDAQFATGNIDGAAERFEQGKALAEGQFGLAKVAHLSNNPAAAREHLTQAVTIDDQYRAAWLYKGEIELQLEDAEAALASFSTAKKLRGLTIPPRVGQVRANLLKGNLEAAEANVNGLIGVAKTYAPAHYLKALVKFRQDDLEAAEVSLQNLQKYSRDHLPGLYLMGVVQARLGNVDKAERNLSRYLDQDPENTAVRKMLASVLSDQDDPKAVIDLLEPYAPASEDPQMWALLGRAYEETGQSSSASEAFARAVELAPDTAPLRNRLALNLLAEGQDEAALAQLDSAVELSPDQLQSDYIRVMVDLREGRLEAAGKTAAEIVTKAPEDPAGHNLVGSVATERGDEAEAVAAFQRALGLDPTYFPAARNLARIAEQNERFAEAVQIYTEFAAQADVDEQASMALVDLHLRRGNIDQGIETLDAAVARYPASIPLNTAQLRMQLATGRLEEGNRTSATLLEMAPNQPDVKLLDAELAIRQGDRERAQKRAGELQALLPKHEGDQGMYAAVGTLQQQLGNHTLARQNLETAAADGEGSVSAILGLVRMELAEGSPRLAKQHLAKLDARGIDSEEVNILKGDTMAAAGESSAALRHYKGMADQGSRAGTTRYATLALQENQTKNAERVLNDWLADHPNDVGIKSLLASAHVKAGKAGNAKSHYESMLPTRDPVILNNLAWIYMVEGNDKALDMARQANAAAPNNPDIADTLGWILVNEGEYQEGLDFLKASARSRPNNPTVQYHLGIAYHHVGEVSRAKRALRKAVSLGDFDEINDARRVLADL